MLRRVAASGLAVATWAAVAASDAAPPPLPAAVVVVYHRFGEEEHPSTNTPLEQLDAHLSALSAGGYRVLPLDEIVAAFRERQPLPERTVAITIDDAYLSAYRHAWPRLRAAGVPFTLFVASDGVDSGLPGLMSWAQLRELAAAGVSIGHHTASHPHPLEQDPASWQEELERAASRFETELGQRPRLLAYPYGEHSRALRAATATAGFSAAFGQHSGTAHAEDDLYALPRFPLNESHGSLDRFERVIASLPLPVTRIEPGDALITERPGEIGFQIGERVGPIARLGCFYEGQPLRLKRDLRHVRIQMPDSISSPNLRINCTLPDSPGRWRWLGLTFFVRL